ncbi:MAG: ribonuclease III [Planctomycetota bacterium]
MAELPHSFRTPDLLRLALTHASTGSEEDNERLEFLGDAVLDLVVAEELFRCHPELPEGDLTELKAWVVSRRVLADAARELDLDAAARLGSGLQHRALPKSVLANLYEAVLGAVYLDAGLEAAKAFALATLQQPLERVRKRQRGANPKQVLQRIGQVETGCPPSYVVLDERGEAHARAFLVAAELGGERYPSAWGRTRKEAERWAAFEALLVLEERDPAVGENGRNGRAAGGGA